MERRREGKARGKFCRGEQARGPTKAYFSSVRPAALPCSVWESRQTSSLMTRLKKKKCGRLTAVLTQPSDIMGRSCGSRFLASGRLMLQNKRAIHCIKLHYAVECGCVTPEAPSLSAPCGIAFLSAAYKLTPELFNPPDCSICRGCFFFLSIKYCKSCV